MVNSTNTNAYMRQANSKPNAPGSNDFTYKTASEKNPSDMPYIDDSPEVKKETQQNTYKKDEPAAFLELSQEAKERLQSKPIIENNRAGDVESGEEVRPSDETRRLTRMLVAAKSPDEVQSVLMDAYSHMKEWQKLASAGDKEAIKVVRKINRLISRGNRKISDLNKEIVMHQRQQRAENAEKNQEARRLENELKEAQRERKARERRYLQERDNKNETKETDFGPSMQGTEAKIRQLASAMAALKTNAVDAGSGGSPGDLTAFEDSGIESSEVSGQDVSGEQE